MKREILAIVKSCLFIAVLVFALDFLVGVVFDNLIKRLPAEGERVAKSYYAFHKVNSDVIIIGSSRAETTYDCEILMDSLPGYSVFNCGGDGQKLVYCSTLINSLLDRYTPNLIVWDVSVGQTGGQDYENLSLIYPYYKEDKNVKNAVDDMEGSSFKYKVLLNSYRYNATAGRILRAYFMKNKPTGSKYGFVPRRTADNTRTLEPKDFTISEDDPFNEKNIEYFRTTLERADRLGCKVVMVISPMYNDFNQDNKHSRKMKELCDTYNAVFIDDSHLEGFIHNNDYAYDRVHVNAKGAEVFSKVFAHQLVEILHMN